MPKKFTPNDLTKSEQRYLELTEKWEDVFDHFNRIALEMESLRKKLRAFPKPKLESNGKITL